MEAFLNYSSFATRWVCRAKSMLDISQIMRKLESSTLGSTRFISFKNAACIGLDPAIEVSFWGAHRACDDGYVTFPFLIRTIEVSLNPSNPSWAHGQSLGTPISCN